MIAKLTVKFFSSGPGKTVAYGRVASMYEEFYNFNETGLRNESSILDMLAWQAHENNVSVRKNGTREEAEERRSACPRGPRKLFHAPYPITWQRYVICQTF